MINRYYLDDATANAVLDKYRSHLADQAEQAEAEGCHDQAAAYEAQEYCFARLRHRAGTAAALAYIGGATVRRLADAVAEH